jgi:oxygen-independent coproporphyrinogen-3 oxidase
MYALPSQRPELALKDIETASALAPTHISYYHLTLEPGTVFHSRPPKALPDEDLAFEIQEQGQQVLASHGYGQYEVSAYARDGAHCRHNLNYWLFGDYLGVGAGAHGKLSSSLPHGVLRTVKSKQPREYQAQAVGRTGEALGERKMVASAELPFEFMLNALRLNEGFAPRCFEERTGLGLQVIEGPLKRAVGSGLLELSHDKWRPTALGRRFLNDLQAIFLV